MEDEMQASDARVVRITFIDGKTRTFAYDPVNVDSASFATAILKTLDAKNFILELSDRILVIPISSILHYEITPKPGQKIPGAINVLYEFD